MQEAIAKRLEERSGATRTPVIKLAFSTISDVLEVKDCQLVVKEHSELDPDVLAAVASVEEMQRQRISHVARKAARQAAGALSLLARVLGMLTNKTEISGPGGKPVEVEHRAQTADRPVALCHDR